jgi:hypothetical protein
MPVHDWTGVEAGIFHDFHVAWIPEIRKSLNGGLLPDGYYALAEQHTGLSIADLLTLHTGLVHAEPPTRGSGGTAVAEAPPRVQRRETLEAATGSRRRTLAIRHVSGHRLVAMLEIVSPANKDRVQSVAEFATKTAEALRAGIHMLMIDLFPPGPFDRQGLHSVIRQYLQQTDEPYELPPDDPLTMASYAAGPRIEAYVEHLAVGAVLTEMPLFLRTDHYVSVPLEPTYLEAFRGMPAFWRDVLQRGKA